MQPKFRPLQDYLLVKPLDRIKSEIIEVVSFKEKLNRGVIVRLGQGQPTKQGYRPFDVKENDVIAFGEFDFFPKYYENNQLYLILQQADVACVFDDVEQAERVH